MIECVFIMVEHRALHGVYQLGGAYPALTQEAKAKIFGLNALRVYGVDRGEAERAKRWDPVARAQQEYEDHPSPSFRSYGPRSRREMLELLRFNRGLPG